MSVLPSSFIHSCMHGLCVILAGGHGALIDLVNDNGCHQLIEKHCKEGKIVAAVGLGPCAFLKCKANDGTSMVKGKKASKQATQLCGAHTHSFLCCSVVCALEKKALTTRLACTV